MENIKKIELGIIAKIIIENEHYFGSECLNTIKNEYINKINIITKSEHVFDIKFFSSAIELWYLLRKKDIEEYINKAFEDELNKLKYICAIAYKIDTKNPFIWRFTEIVKNKNDELFNAINKLMPNKHGEFSDSQLYVFAYFISQYNKGQLDNLINIEDSKVCEIVNDCKKT